jgi:hypothetical protein
VENSSGHPRIAIGWTARIWPGSIRDLQNSSQNLRGLLQPGRSRPAPGDQILLAVAQDLLSEPELAVAHKLAGLLRQTSQAHLLAFTGAGRGLGTIARNERRFLGIGETIPDLIRNYKGRPVVATVHKSKGLEWDRVYLISGEPVHFGGIGLEICMFLKNGSSGQAEPGGGSARPANSNRLAG